MGNKEKFILVATLIIAGCTQQAEPTNAQTTPSPSPHKPRPSETLTPATRTPKPLIATPTLERVLENTAPESMNRLVFSRDTDPDPDVFSYDIFTSNLNGTEESQLTDIDTSDEEKKDELNGRVSPDGSTMVFTSNRGEYGGNHVIVSKNLATGKETVLTKGDHQYWDASWSPDGEWLYLGVDYDDIHRMRADGSELENITNMPGEQWKPEASPDGNYLYFTSGIINPDNPEGAAKLMRLDLRTLDKDKFDHPEIVTLTDGFYHNVNKEDGRIVFCKTDPNGHDKLWIMDPDTFKEDDEDSLELYKIPGQEGEFDNSDPSWANVTQNSDTVWKILYVSTIRGEYDIHIVDLDGNNSKEIKGQDKLYEDGKSPDSLRELSPEGYSSK